MPRRRIAAKRKRFPLNPTQWAVLADQPVPPVEEGGDPWEALALEAPDGEALHALWEEFRDVVLAQWIRELPGTRPPVWWRFDAPEPRQRQGGKGRPLAEVAGGPVVLERGIPTEWAAVDRRDPPRFEAEGAYLARLSLLSAAERKALRGKVPPAEVVDLDD